MPKRGGAIRPFFFLSAASGLSRPQKSRLLRAETKLPSEKAPQATFSNELAELVGCRLRLISYDAVVRRKPTAAECRSTLRKVLRASAARLLVTAAQGRSQRAPQGCLVSPFAPRPLSGRTGRMPGIPGRRSGPPRHGRRWSAVAGPTTPMPRRRPRRAPRARSGAGCAPLDAFAADAVENDKSAPAELTAPQRFRHSSDRDR